MRSGMPAKKGTSADLIELGSMQVAVREGTVDDAPDFGHAFEHRADPARRQGVEAQAVRVFVQAPEQRLGEDGVADPGGRDDQGFHGAAVTRSSGRRAAPTA